MANNTLAPIVLFVYNRPWHTQQTVEALARNVLAKNSELYIFSDAAKTKSDKSAVDNVRAYINDIKSFKTLHVVEREINHGLAESIVSGVSQIVEKHGRVIVLEDDLLTGPYFLTFMNDSLSMYADDKKVMHISGWNYPVDAVGLESTFLWRNMSCWGWATWSDRWQNFNNDASSYIKIFSRQDRRRFNLDGYNSSWDQIMANHRGRRKTWAIFWYASIFNNDGLCLNPTISLVENIGHDDSGIHCVGYAPFDHTFDSAPVNLNKQPLIENKLALQRIQQHLKDNSQSLGSRIFYRLRNLYKRHTSKWNN